MSRTEPQERAPLRLPVSAKGVILRDERVLLARNDRDEWELPGGRLEAGEQVADAVRREVLEETGLAVEVGQVLLAEVFAPVPGATVLIVAHATTLHGGAALRRSDEHLELAWVPTADLDRLPLPPVYREAITRATAAGGTLP